MFATDATLLPIVGVEGLADTVRTHPLPTSYITARRGQGTLYLQRPLDRRRSGHTVNQIVDPDG